MAQALSRTERDGDLFGNVDQQRYLTFMDEYADADEAVKDAVIARKNLRERIEGAGIPTTAFDRARRDSEKSGAIRDRDEKWYRQMMAWQNKPVDAAGGAALNVHLLKKIDNEAMEAGRTGRRQDSNPYSPGTEEFQRWDTAWLRGQGQRASDTGAEAPRRRGRPPGSRNKPRGAAAADGKPDLTVHEGGAAGEPDTETRH